MNNLANINSTTNMQDILLSSIIKKGSQSYNSDGDTCMDKIQDIKKKRYQYDNNILEVERYFANNTHINEILKNYIYEQQKKNTISNSTEKCYNNESNITVVDFSEGRNK